MVKHQHLIQLQMALIQFHALYISISKKQNIGVVPGIKEFAQEFLSEKAAGGRGYLRTRGLVSLPAGERARNASIVDNMSVMAAPKN